MPLNTSGETTQECGPTLEISVRQNTWKFLHCSLRELPEDLVSQPQFFENRIHIAFSGIRNQHLAEIETVPIVFLY